MRKTANRSAAATGPRWLALQSILQVTRNGRALDEAFETELANLPELDSRDRGLCREIASGVCRWYYVLAAIIKPKLRKNFKRKDHDIEIILMIGAYQLLFMETEPHAAVNETVKLAQWQHKVWAKGLVNGVLRQLVRDAVNIDSVKAADAYPGWMQELIARDWPDSVDAILDAGNRRATMTLRADLLQASVEHTIERLKAHGIDAQPHNIVPSAIVLARPHAVADIVGFDEGKLSVQDASAQLAASLLDCHEGMRVLDACAAPGGKTAHILQLVCGLDLVALDKSRLRLALVAQNLKRIGCRAELVEGDAAHAQDWHDGTLFDRILADVPCSGSGVIRRHPDIKLLRRATDIKQLAEQQKQILQSLWQLLKPGGMLLYSTCSVFKDENERQIEAFVSENENCAEISLDSVEWGQRRPRGRQILPGWEAMDGFYYARLQKINQVVDQAL